MPILEVILKSNLKQLILGLLFVQLAVGCSSVGRSLADDDDILQKQRIQTGMTALDKLSNKDALIQINNTLLEQHFRSRLLLLSSPEITFQNVEVSFSKQTITLETGFELLAQNGAPTRGVASGDVHLVIGGNRLFWFPKFNHILLTNDESNPPSEPASPADKAQTESILDVINSTAEAGLWMQHNNAIQLGLDIPGYVEMTANVQRFSVTSNPVEHPLKGLVTVQNSVILIDSKQTSILLDLEFVSGLSHCPTEFSVSRSAFTRKISAREPKDLAREVITHGEELNYYTELSSTRRPFTLVHYWFADGRPVEASELPVEAGARWRTWSTMLVDPSIGTHWEVFAVDKESGCVVDSAVIDSRFSVENSKSVTNADTSFAQFRDAFQQRVSSFSSSNKTAAIILFEVSRTFVRDAINVALKNANYGLTFELKSDHPQIFSSILGPFESADIQCDLRVCDVETDCKADFSQCELRKDTSACQTCALHNPLNNRCLREVLDLACQEIKDFRNRRYEFNWNACLAKEENRQQDCQLDIAQRIQACESDAQAEQAACEHQKDIVTRQADVLADVHGQLQLSGSLTLIMSKMEIAEDFEKVQMDLVTVSNLGLDGAVNFSPRPGFEAATSCMTAWSSKFQSQEIGAPLPDRRIGSINFSSNELIANWSAFSTAVMLNPSPMEAIFQTRQESIDDCGLGLNPDRVAAAVSEETGELLNGVLFFDFDQITNRIVFSNIHVSIAGIEHLAEPRLAEQHLLYEIN